MFKLGILTISTSGYRGTREDVSGKIIEELLPVPEYQVLRYEIVPDDRDMIEDRLRLWSDQDRLDIIITTGGTGLGPRDITPEACLSVIDRQVYGLSEAMRAQTITNTPFAMLSRSVSGIRGGTLIITLPGSPRAVEECLRVIIPVIPHALEILSGESDGHTKK